MVAILKFFKWHLLPNPKFNWAEIWWEASQWHRHSKLLKSFPSDIQDGRAAILKFFRQCLLVNPKSDWDETWWEASQWHWDSKLLKSFHSDIQDGRGHLEILQMSSPPKQSCLLQLLLQFLRDFDETFQLLFPWPEDDHILSRSCSTDFYRVIALWQFFNSKSCLCNSSCSFQRILVKLSVIVAMTWGGSYFMEVALDCFLPELWLFVSFSHLSTEVLVSSYFSQGILMKLSSYCFRDLKMIIFYRGHTQLIFSRVIALWQFLNSKSCLCNSSCNF